LIDEQFFKENLFKITDEEADGLVDDIKALHRNISELNHHAIIKLADRVFVQTEDFKKLKQEDIDSYFIVKTFMRDEVIEIFKRAIKDGRLNIDSIHAEKVRAILR